LKKAEFWTRPKVAQTRVEPQVQAFHDRGYVIYRKLYQDLKDSFTMISDLVRG
jgi:hypothetical protein